MHLGYTRALHIDTIDRGAGAPKRYKFRASTAGKARGDNYLLAADGWDLADYRQYPIILAFHNARSFPIGIATDLQVDADGLIDEVEFDDGDPLGKDAMRKLDRGIPIAQSVSFDVLDTDNARRSDGLIQSTRQSLLEVSMVGLPSDPGALPMRYYEPYMDGGMNLPPAPSLVDLLAAISKRLTAGVGELTAGEVSALSHFFHEIHPTMRSFTTQPIAPTDEPSLLDLLATVRLRLAADPRDLSEAERLALSAIAEAVRPPTPRVHPDLLARLEEMTTRV
jgi:HK97 family phage prohead protease